MFVSCSSNIDGLVLLQPARLFLLSLSVNILACLCQSKVVCCFVQDTFARAYAALDRYDPSQSFTTWLFVIGRRLAANEKRRIARQRVRETEAIAEEQLEQTSPDLDAGNVWAAAKSILPDAAYASLWLHYGEGQSVKEIARILGKTVTAVKVTLFRARRTLARELDPNLVKESINR